jgi:hypothetical protein
MQSAELNLFHEPKDRLRLTVGDQKSYVTVKPAWASPLTHPKRFLALLDGKGDEITMLSQPEELPATSLDAVKRELSRRYLSSTVLKILDASNEFGATYWHVETDVDGNRFELTDTSTLDNKSRVLLDAIL